MKLYHSLRPHPRVGAGREVRMLLREKGMTIDAVDIDMMNRETRAADFLAKNPAGQLPALELDDGRVIAESVTICELLEERQPAPAIVGATAEERAETRMWLRRIEFGITENIVNGWRFGEGQAFWQGRGRTIPEASEGLKAIARDKLAWLEAQLGDRPFIAGARFTLADIVLFVGLDFAEMVGQPLDPALTRLTGWRQRVAARPSADASLQA